MSVTPPEISAEVLAQRKELVEIYIRAQERLVKRLTSAKLTDFARFRINEQLQQINAIIGTLNAEAKEAMPGIVSGYYQHGANIADLALNAQGVKVSALNLGNRIHTAAVKAVAEQMALDLATANTTMKTTATRILRQTQQTLIEERRINQIIADGIVTGESRRETSARLKDALINEIGEGKLVQAGKFRYTPEYYAELVTRTRTREAVTQGAVTRSMEYGITLFQVSIHDSPCPQCSQYQGKVYSLTPDSGFPMLEARPPYHPHCFLPNTRVTAPDLCAAFESSYDGPVVDVFMESGRHFWVTPNHPLLSVDRFLRAGDLVVGSLLVISNADAEMETIECVFQNRCIPISEATSEPDAFHGDGAAMNGNTTTALAYKSVSGPSGAVGALTDVVGPATDRFGTNSVNAKALRALLSNPQSPFGIDRVDRVSHGDYSGKVYDLETRSGLYCAEGIVSSNCRHVLLPYVERPGEKGQAKHEAIKALSNQKGPIPGNTPGFEYLESQARATGGLRKKQIQGEGRTKKSKTADGDNPVVVQRRTTGSPGETIPTRI